MKKALKIINIILGSLGMIMLCLMASFEINRHMTIEGMPTGDIINNLKFLSLLLMAIIGYFSAAFSSRDKLVLYINSVVVIVGLYILYPTVVDLEGVFLFTPFILLAAVNIKSRFKKDDNSRPTK